MTEDALTVEFEPDRGPRRRLRFEPRGRDSYERVEEEWTGCTWRATGREIVDELSIDRGAEVVA